MIRRFNFLALIFGVAGLTFVNLTVPVAQGRDRYFPPHAFDVIIHPYNSVTRKYDRPAQVMRGDFSEFWYSKQLAALREEPLYGRPSQGTVYRLTWLRSFDKPMTFRWTISPAGGSTLLAKRARRQVMLSGQEGEMIGVCRKKESSPCEYAEPTPGERVLHRLKGKWQFFRRRLFPAGLDVNKSVTLDADTTRDLEQELTAMSFWRLPSRSSELPGQDGSSWILEGARDGEYHVVQRWIGRDIGNWGLKLMRASGVDLGEVY